ncbi:MAG: radical SAM protein [Rhodocyclales bacterium]|nr:radical SAM protein [Rhodocyclales bacterium]
MATLYSNLKFLRYTDRLDALRERRMAAPVHIRIKPINHCNHDCWYCAYRVGNLQLGEDIDYKDKIPEAKMFEIVDDVIEMGVKAVTFSGGGEPLLYKPLPEVVRRLATGGVKVATLTNGANLKGRMADAFAEYGTWVRISTDAWDDASFAKSRRIKEGELTALLRHMTDFSARGSQCTLGVSFIVDATNCDHLLEACVQFKQAGVDHVKFSGVVVSNSGAENNAYHARIRERLEPQIEKVKALADDRFAVIDHYHELEERFEKHYHSCPYLMYLTVIGADCVVYTCQDKAFTQSGTLGSIKERRFKDFWFSEENRQRVFGLDPAKVCNHHCVTHGKNLAIHDVLGLDPDHGAFV